MYQRVALAVFVVEEPAVILIAVPCFGQSAKPTVRVTGKTSYDPRFTGRRPGKHRRVTVSIAFRLVEKTNDVAWLENTTVHNLLALVAGNSFRENLGAVGSDESCDQLIGAKRLVNLDALLHDAARDIVSAIVEFVVRHHCVRHLPNYSIHGATEYAGLGDQLAGDKEDLPTVGSGRVHLLAPVGQRSPTAGDGDLVIVAHAIPELFCIRYGSVSIDRHTGCLLFQLVRRPLISFLPNPACLRSAEAWQVPPPGR